MIGLFDTSSPLAPLKDELHAAVARVIDGGAYILGPEVAAFERDLAAYLGVADAIGVANGTDAITVALRALGVGPGDDVLVPSFTFYASAEAIPPTGANPVFCDVDPETFLLTPEAVEAALTPSTKAIVAVHLFGNVVDVEAIRAVAPGVAILEDAAQAAGSLAADGRRPGALGDVATFSFYPSKNLGAFGDGGAVTTNDPALAERVRVFRFHGSHDKVTYAEVGYNSRLDEVQAAWLRVLLPHLDGWCAQRRQVARWYEEEGLGGLVGLPVAAPGSDPAWHLYVVRHPDAARLEGALAEHGVQARGYYRTPVHLQDAMRPWPPAVMLPGTEQAAREHLAIPFGPALTREQVQTVVQAVRTSL